MYRILDFLISAILLFVTLPILIIVIIVGIFDTGSPIFIQKRIGRDRKIFKLIKFRTMSKDSPNIASHLSNPSEITTIGKVLRKTKIDELPQLINVLRGDMSLVGPRPNLENQYELIEEREKMKVYNVLPGITGKAQVMNVDMSSPVELAKLDREMIVTLTISNYFRYLFATATGKGFGDAANRTK